jgi:hypothetical protein
MTWSAGGTQPSQTAVAHIRLGIGVTTLAARTRDVEKTICLARHDALNRADGRKQGALRTGARIRSGRFRAKAVSDRLATAPHCADSSSPSGTGLGPWISNDAILTHILYYFRFSSSTLAQEWPRRLSRCGSLPFLVKLALN